ncbi:MAG: TfuA-related McrA-glycine thioamidation protein, partial [Methanoregula sp.]|nr:TfuA-related McrA-glycine thioamidation protein [Methanoregula sp.]
ESDDEVALVFDPESGLALSEPLINIRCTLKRALDTRVIGPAAHDALLLSARSLFYPKRTYQAIVSAVGDALDEKTRDRFLNWVISGACDQKREDAVAALEYIRDSVE